MAKESLDVDLEIKRCFWTKYAFLGWVSQKQKLSCVYCASGLLSRNLWGSEGNTAGQQKNLGKKIKSAEAQPQSHLWISGEWTAQQNCSDLRQGSWTFTSYFSQSLTLEGKTSQESLGEVTLFSLDQLFSMYGPQISITWELVSNDGFLDLSLDLLNQKFWGWGPAICGLTSSPGDSAAQ